MAEKLYEGTLTKFLSIDARLFNDDPNSGTLQAWTTFQAIANIAFVILLLVVIFSQLTGAGIDNYGIKKILPKLIVAAILINLSYILCRLAIDISNILGFGLKRLFDNIPVTLTVAGETVGSGGANIITILILALIGGVGIAAIVSSGLAILLPLLLGILSVAIAIFFVFLLLGAREAGVVILTVISPLAIACLMLPNTKKLFDKWLKMFQGLLLLFPLCGLLMGGASLASRIILSTDPDEFWTSLVALLIGVIPLFFLPTLLKASFAAMGNMGAKISGFGQGFNKKVGGAAKSGLEKSRFGQWANRGKNYKEHMRGEREKYNQEQLQTRRAQRSIDRLGSRNNLSGAQRNRLAIASRTVDANEQNEIATGSILYATQNPNATDDQINTDFENAMNSGNTSQAASILDFANKRNPANASKMVSSLATARDLGAGELSMLNKFMRNNQSFASNMVTKDRVTAEYIQNNGLSNGAGSYVRNGVTHTVAAAGAKVDRNFYAQAGQSSGDKATDWIGARSSVINEAINGGAITSDMAYSLVNSTNTTTQDWLRADPTMLGQLESHAASSNKGLQDSLASTIADEQVDQAERDAAYQQYLEGEEIIHQKAQQDIRHEEVIVATRGINTGTGFYDVPSASYVPDITDRSGNTFKDPTTGRKFDRRTGRIT